MEARPTLVSPVVVLDYAARIWNAMKVQCVDIAVLDDKRALRDLNEALVASDDAYLRGVFLHDRGWVVDERVVDLLHTRTNWHQRAQEDAETQWVLKSGARFPAKEGDTVMFYSETGFEKTGYVEGVIRSRARALIRVAGATKDIASVLHTVPAEKVRSVLTSKGPVAVTAITRMVG